jgi:hypothetical protein
MTEAATPSERKMPSSKQSGVSNRHQSAVIVQPKKRGRIVESRTVKITSRVAGKSYETGVASGARRWW